jgi:hypothetical protein
MPAITIYNDSESDMDCDFDVVEVVNGVEISRQTLVPDRKYNDFRLAAGNQAFVIVPKGCAWPLEIVTETKSAYRRA